jgi:hypothetical protein
MAYAIDSARQTGFDQAGWLRLRGWTYSGGDYVIVVHGDRFLIADRAKLGSLDELNRPLDTGHSSTLVSRQLPAESWNAALSSAA